MQYEQDGRIVRLHHHRGGDSFQFYSAIGEFRGSIGPPVAAIAFQYGVDVEDEWARVLPAPDGDPESDRALRTKGTRRAGDAGRGGL